ncbi:hypothetical protein CWS02_00385 [Enterobacter sp. EA-1]|nr:hypothetical protein CWS02_00385 [Enterobacter sp. EA-1]
MLSDDECLDLNDKSENDLKDIYNKKLNELTAFDLHSLVAGVTGTKERMLATYKQNQQDWVQYRNNYCELISTQAQGTHAFTENMLSCVLNMNKIRGDQIRMITP